MEVATLAHLVHQALATVIYTAGLEPRVASRVSRCMEQHIYVCAYPSANAEDFAAWAEETMAALLSAEDIGPHCPFVLSEWFAREVFCWLSGNFDNKAFETA